MSTQFTNRQWRLPNNENKDKQSNYSFTDSGTVNISQPAEVGITSSYSFWMNRNSATANTGYFYNVVGTAGYGMFFLNSSKIYLRYGGASYIILSSTELTNAILQINVWQNWTITRKEVSATAQDIKLYVDGVKVVEVLNTTGVGTLGSSVKQVFGAGSIIKMDSFSVFDYVLSPSQITTLQGSSSTGIGNPMSLSPKPVAYYPLGDQDAFNGANYLVPNSSLKDYVFDFPGNGDNITIDNLFNFSGSDLCISIWYNSNSVVNYDYLLYRFGGSSVLNVYVLNNKLRYEIYAGSTRYRIEGNVVFDGNWHNSIMIFNDTAKTWTVYEDSVFVNTLTATASIDSATTSVYIGSYGGSTGNDYSGLVSNLVIWNSDQSSEKDNIYNNGTPASSYTNTPSGWWKLDASDTYDSSTGNWTIEDHAGSNDGTSSGMTQANLVQSDLSFTSGYSPYALDFDSASSDYIDLGTDSSLDIFGGDFSVSLWFKHTMSSGSAIAMIEIGGYTNKMAITLGLSSNTGVGFAVDNNWNYNAGSGYNDGNWHHIVATRTSTTYKIYVDNTEILFSSGSYAYLTFNTIGKGKFGGNFNGFMSNISLWNTALTDGTGGTPNQIAEIYNEGVPSNLNNHSAYSNLVSWWQLGSNSSFNTNWTVLDEKGSNNGTSSNMGEDAIVDGVGSYANGLSSGMGGDEVIGDAPYSTANALSVNMDVEDRVTDTPS
jgi:hypothetical protein